MMLSLFYGRLELRLDSMAMMFTFRDLEDPWRMPVPAVQQTRLLYFHIYRAEDGQLLLLPTSMSFPGDYCIVVPAWIVLLTTVSMLYLLRKISIFVCRKNTHSV
jgi:hypothetical protein